MPVLVEVPNVGEIEFPDSLSEDDISQEIRKLTGEEEAKPAAEEEAVTPARPYPQDFLSQIKRAPSEIAFGAGAAGTFLRAAGQDIFNRLVGAPPTGEEISNIEAAKRIAGERSEALIQGELPQSLQEPRTELPIQQTIRAMPTVPRLAASAGAGLVETAPQMAVVGLEQAAGVPLPVALAGTFGFTPEGKFDPKSAIMAAAIPFVGKYSGELGGLIARKFGVDNATAVNVVKGASGLLGPLAGMLAEGEREISKLPEDQKTNARMDLYANLLGQAAFGPIGVQYERKPNASRIQEAATIHGDVRPQPVQGVREMPVKESRAGVQPRPEEAVQAGQARVLLTPEESAHLEAQRGTIEAPVEVAESIPEGDPLAANIATIDRKTGTVRINPERFSAWLKAIPEKNRPEAVRSLLSEEQIHLKVTPEQALDYWNNLTAAEKLIQRRRYSGSWKGEGVSDTNMGHEAVRFRMQQLARMTPREIAEAVGREKWKLKGITAMEDVVRGLRETLKTTASKEQLAILDRIENGIATAKAVLTGKAEEKPEEPFAAMKPQQVTIERPDGSKYEAEFNGYYDFRALGRGIQPSIGYTLPEGGVSHGFLRPGEKIVTEIPPFEEEPAARPKKQKETSEQAMMFLPPLRTGEVVSREAFSTATPNEISKAAEAHLSGTPDFGKFVGELQSKFGSGINRSQLSDVWQDAVWKKVMEAKGPELERLRDELNLRRTMGSKEVPDPSGVRPTQPEDRKVFVARQKYRQQVARAVALKLIGQVRERSKERLFRPALEPDDVAFEKPKAFQELGTTESQSTPILKRLLREGARLSGEAVSNTRRVVALVNKKTGEVHLVSAYPHGGEGVRIVDPTTTLTGRPNIPLESLPKNFRPIATALIDEPVKNFHQKFASVDEWNAKFADEARSRIQEQASREALLEEGAGVIEPGEAVASVLRTGDRLTNAEAGGVLDHLYNEVSKIESPEDVKLAFEGLADKPNWQVISAYQKMFESLARKNPKLAPGEVLDLLTKEIYETANQSPTREDFVRRSLERYEGESPEAVRTGETTPTTAAPETSTGRELRALDRPPIPAYPAPKVLPRPQRAFPYEPGAMPKVRQAAEDMWTKVSEGVATWAARRATVHDISALRDRADNVANIIGDQAEKAVRLESARKGARTGRPEVLAGANAVLAAHGDQRLIPTFMRMVDQGAQQAIALSRSTNPVQRLRGRAWLRGAQKLRGELEYANAHWNDPELQATAASIRKELDEAFVRESNAGINLRYDPDYVPGRYEAELFNDNSVIFGPKEILGKQWRAPKTFANYYEAISKGPYVAVTRDGASLVGHRVRQGMRKINYRLWVNSLKSVTDPATGNPVATSPKRRPDGKLSPSSPEHELTYLMPGEDPLSVRKGYVGLVEALAGTSKASSSSLKRGALMFSQALKHTILLGDFFHLARLGYYGSSIMGRKFGYGAAASILEYRPQDFQRAVQRGLIRPKDVAWANKQFTVNLGARQIQMTRLDIANAFIRQTGLNVGRIQDAIYKDVVRNIPVLGGYNRWLFDRFTRGLMLESAVLEFERQHTANPNADVRRMFKDIAKDTNEFFGSIGRQGWIKSQTTQDLARMIFLAPQWVEGLVRKEAAFYGRTSGLSRLTTRRQLPMMGTTGRGIARGLFTMFMLTQAANLIFRRKPTWENEEEGHKMDAWIPGHGEEGDQAGFFVSPLAVFNELSHDLVRYVENKPKAWDAVVQIGQNKLGPLGRLGVVLASSKTGAGQLIKTSPGVLAEATKSLVPVPISFGRLGQAALHAALPGAVPPPAPGSIERQLFGTAGIKAEPGATANQQIVKLADEFMTSEGLKKETGFEMVPTDEPSYSRLRSALRSGDEAGAKRIYEHLTKTRKPTEVAADMKRWKDLPFTRNRKAETFFQYSLNDAQRELYAQAVLDRQALYRAWVEFYYSQ